MKSNGKQTRRRPIEREYLATLNAAVPLETWRKICQQAADAALDGDARARDWLSKWLLGTESRLLTTLAAEESGETPESVADQEIAARRQRFDDDRRDMEQNRALLRQFDALHAS